MRGASLGPALTLLLAACALPQEPVASGDPYPDRPGPAGAVQAELADEVAGSLVSDVGPHVAGADGGRKAVEWALLKLTVLGFENVRAEPAGPAANVVGEIRGPAPGIVLLGAHLGPADAAGVGAVIAAAHRIAGHGTPRRTIRVVLFAGAGGGEAYARAHADEIARHVLVLEAGARGAPPDRLAVRVAEADRAEVARLARALGFEGGMDGHAGTGDAGPLRKLGVPGIVVSQDSRYGLARVTDVFAELARAASERDPAFTRLPTGR